LTEFFHYDRDEIEGTSEFCRAEKIPFIYAHVNACSARILTDFGEKFKVLEENSEEIPDVMIHSISATPEKEGIATVKLIDGFKH
jgi:hypothetical protein